MLHEDKDIFIERVEGVFADPSDPSPTSFLDLEFVAQSLEWLETTRRWSQEDLRDPDADTAEAKRDIEEATEEIAEHRRLLAEPVMVMYRFRTSEHGVVMLPESEYERDAATQRVTPVSVTSTDGPRFWWYLDRFWWENEGLEPDEVQVLVLQRDRKKQAVLERARAEVFGTAANQSVDRPRREPIPESVRHEVWRRDRGACVDCGSRERLEFDHIIPVSKGGSNTARNLELRCESCNRRKGAAI